MSNGDQRESAVPRPAFGRVWLLCTFATLVALSLFLMRERGAFASDFGAFDDEPAHVVTGLMVYDWIRSGFMSPFAFANDYYLHYPKVSIGQWPPVLYAIEGLWMLLLGAGTATLMSLFAVFAAAVATHIATAAWPVSDRATSLAAAGAFLFVPLVQHFGAMALTEVPLALFCSLAVWYFGRYCDDRRQRLLWCFAITALLAIMTKGNGLALAMVPPLTIVLTRRWSMLTSRSLWVAAIALGAAVVPWYWIATRFSTSTWEQTSPSWDYATTALRYYGTGVVRTLGFGVTILAVIGLASGLSRPGLRTRWSAILSWLVAWLLMHAIVPSSMEDRHLILVLPVILVAAAHGASVAIRWLRLPAGMAAILLLGPFCIENWKWERKEWHGYGALVERLDSEADLKGGAFLIASDGQGEGAFVAGAAIRSPTPKRIVLRASKVLGSDDWRGRNYKPRFDTIDELAKWLRDVPISVVVIDEGARQKQRFTHQQQLLDLMRQPNSGWLPLDPQRLVRDGDKIEPGLLVFRQQGIDGRNVDVGQIRPLLNR